MGTPFLIDYAAPELSQRPMRVVLQLGAISALVLAVGPCFSVVFDFYRYSFEQPGTMFGGWWSGWMVAHWLTGVLLLFLAWRAWRLRRIGSPTPASLGALRWLFGIAILVIVVLDVTPLVIWFLSGTAKSLAWTPAHRTAFYAHLLSQLSVYGSLLLVPLLAAGDDSARRRVLGLAVAAAALLIGSGHGVYRILMDGDRWANTSVSLALREALSAYGSRPSGLFNAWPLMSLAGAALFVIAIIHPRRPIVVAGLACGMIFVSCRAWSAFEWPVGYGKLDRWMQTQACIDQVKLVVCDAIPLALLMWMLTRGGDFTTRSPTN